MTTTNAARPKLLTGAPSLVALLVACAPWATHSVLEKLDPVSGTTVITLNQPAELVTEQSRGPQLDPYAFIAPFEIDRMGNRGLYLWVAAPQDKGVVRQAQILCDGAPLALDRLDGLPPDLSRPPYPLPAPWSAAWYYSLSDSALKCMAAAQHVALVTQLAGDVEDRFNGEADVVQALAAFAAHHANPL